MANRRYSSLFERLAGEPASRAGLASEESLVASVAAHLARMLGTRAGSVQALPDYGLPDLNDMDASLHESLMTSRAAIERFVQAYEPRLSDVRITLEPGHRDALRLPFSLSGVLNADGIKRPVSFCVRMSGQGQVSVTHD